MGASVADERVRAIVADDHPLYREGVVRALGACGRVEIVAEEADGRAALEAIRGHRPRVALIDYRLPGLDGVAVARAVARDGLGTRVVLLSAFTEGDLVYRALQSGAAGYVAKEARREEIVDAVLASARGESVLGLGLASGLASEIRLRANGDGPALTSREREILALVASGMSLPEVACELHLAVTTIKTHVRHLYEKLDVSDRAAAVAEGMRAGLIE